MILEHLLKSMSHKPAQQSNKTQPNQTPSVSLSRTEVFSGPLPHPNILAQYEAIVPGAAERIIVMAENQSRHRIAMEDRVIQSDIRNSKYGQIFGFIIAVLGLVISCVLVLTGYTLSGTIFAGVILLSLVSVFVSGSVSRRNERTEKDKALNESLTNSPKIHNGN